MFGRTEIQRTVLVVVALLVTAGSTAALAREFRAADAQNENHPTVQALRFVGRQVAERRGGRHEIRAQQSERTSELMRAPGAAPVELPYGQVPTGLATRPVDRAEDNRPSYVTTDRCEHAGHDQRIRNVE